MEGKSTASGNVNGTLSPGHLAVKDVRKRHSFFLKFVGFLGLLSKEHTAFKMT